MTIFHRALTLCAVVLISLAAPGITPMPRALASSADVAVNVEGGLVYQKIDGFGVNANARSWNNGQLTPALDLLVDQMGAQIFRVILEKSDWQQGADGSDLASFNWDYYTPIYETPKFQNLWGTIAYLNAKHVPQVMLSLMGTIPDWMGGSTLSSDQEDQWVKMVASLVYYGRNVRHVQFTMLSPMNEQDAGAPEGPRMSPEQYARVVSKLTARLAALGLDDIRIVGPDTAGAGSAANSYAPLMFADPSLMAQVDHLSVHAYSGDTGPMDAALRQSAYGDRNFWITEWSAWCAGCDRGQPVAAEWSFASSTTDQLFDLLDHGASAALVYEGYDSYYEHHGAFSYWGQLAFDADAGTYTPRKRFYTNAQVFRFVPAGTVRVGSSTSDDAVRVVAFRDPSSGLFTLVGHNTRSTDVTLRATLGAMPAVQTALHLYQTTQTADLVQGPDVAVQDGTFSVTVAGDGFFTLTTLGDVSPAPPVAAAPAAPAQAEAPLSAPAAPTSTASVLVGDARIEPGHDTELGGTAEAFQYTAEGSGTANRLHLYLGEGTTADDVQVGLYGEVGARPADLIATGSLAHPAGGTWNAIDLPPVEIAAGTRYWIAVLAPGGGQLDVRDAGDTGSPSVTGASTDLHSLPATWGGSDATWASSPLSAYLTHEP